MFAACRLMETVDVLGDDGGQFACRLQFSQLFVGGIGLHPGKQHLFLIKLVKLPSMGHEKAVTQDGFGGIFPLLIVKAVHTAEIGHARFGADARTAEKDDGFCFINILLQGFKFGHGIFLLEIVIPRSAATWESASYISIKRTDCHGPVALTMTRFGFIFPAAGFPPADGWSAPGADFQW